MSDVPIEIFTKENSNKSNNYVGNLAFKPEEYIKKSDSGFVGLLNQGATCYLNSLLQALFVTDGFRNYILSWVYNQNEYKNVEYCIPYQLQLLFARLAFSKRSCVSTKTLTHSFRWSEAESFRQHDVQELLRVLLDALENDWYKHPPKDNTLKVFPITELFQGYIIDYISCPDCKYSRERRDRFMDLSLVVSGNKTLHEALKKYVEPEILSGSNAWRCSGCNEKVSAKKGLRFDHQSMPKILTLQLKRFIFDWNTNTRIKVHDRLEFPNQLDMNQFMEINEQNELLKYNLYAILMHSGTAMGGHYYAFLKPHDRWMGFNDSIIEYVEEEKVMKAAFGGEESTTSAYMLMYQQIDEIKEQMNNMKIEKNSDDNKCPYYEQVNDSLKEIINKEDLEFDKEQAELERLRRLLEFIVLYDHQEKTFKFDLDTPVHEVRTSIIKDLEPNLCKDDMDLLRLRFYDIRIGFPGKVFVEENDKQTIQLLGCGRITHLMLEKRNNDEEFPSYDPNAIPLRLITVTNDNVETVVESSTYSLIPADMKRFDNKDCYVLYINNNANMNELFNQVKNITQNDNFTINRLHYDHVEVLSDNAIKTLKDVEIFAGAFLFISDPKLLVETFEMIKCRIKIEFNIPLTIEEKKARKDHIFDQALQINKNNTLQQLKDAIGEKLDQAVDTFRIKAARYDCQQWKDLTKTIKDCQLTDGSVVYVENGKQLKPDEFEIRLVYYDPGNKRPLRPLGKLILNKSIRASELKRKVITYLNEKKSDGAGGNIFGIEYVRLRKKLKKNIGDIFQDAWRLSKCVRRLVDGAEIAVQKIPMEETVSQKDRVILIQQFFPETIELGAKTEIVIKSTGKVLELKEKISKLTNIETEHIGIVKAPTITTYGAKKISKLKFNQVKDDALLNVMPFRLRDGDLVIFRDNRQQPKAEAESSNEKAVPTKRRAYKPSTSKSTYKRPEYSLKIYTEDDDV